MLLECEVRFRFLGSSPYLELTPSPAGPGRADSLLCAGRQFGLLVSGGSDEHDGYKHYQHLGQEPVTQEMVEALRARAPPF